MKSLIFMMMLSMFLVSAGVVYLSLNRDPSGGLPNVDVALDPAPAEEAKAETPPPEDASAAPTVDAAADPLLAAPAADTAGADQIGLGTAVDTDSTEPLTTTAFPIPEADPAAPETPADTGEAPATVDQ
jgi:hypothetical protein